MLNSLSAASGSQAFQPRADSQYLPPVGRALDSVGERRNDDDVAPDVPSDRSNPIKCRRLLQDPLVLAVLQRDAQHGATPGDDDVFARQVERQTVTLGTLLGKGEKGEMRKLLSSSPHPFRFPLPWRHSPWPWSSSRKFCLTGLFFGSTGGPAAFST